MIKMTGKLKERISHILSALDKEYGTGHLLPKLRDPLAALVAVILSAQCTDARVNIVTADLFKKYPTIKDFAAADLKELEQDIRSIGFIIYESQKHYPVCKAAGGRVRRYCAGKTGRPAYTGRCGSEDCQCDPGKYLPCAKYCGGYPCKAHFQEAGAYKRDRAGKDRVGSDEDTSGRSLDSLEYPYHYFRADHLYCQKAGLRKLLLKQWCLPVKPGSFQKYKKQIKQGKYKNQKNSEFV